MKKVFMAVTLLLLVVAGVSAQVYKFPQVLTQNAPFALVVGVNAYAADTIASANIAQVLLMSIGNPPAYDVKSYLDNEVKEEMIGKYNWFAVGNPSLNSFVARFTQRQMPQGMVEVTVFPNPYDKKKMMMIINSPADYEQRQGPSVIPAVNVLLEKYKQNKQSITLASVNCVDIKGKTIMEGLCLAADATTSVASIAPPVPSFVPSKEKVAYEAYEKEPMTNVPQPQLATPTEVPVVPREHNVATSYKDTATPTEVPVVPREHNVATSYKDTGSGSDQIIDAKKQCESRGCRWDYIYIMCDYIPQGKTFEEACGKAFQGGWQCICPPKEKKIGGEGCYVNHDIGKFVPYGTRLLDEKNNPVYCDLDGSLKEQKQDRSQAQNSYECLSNFQSDGKCVSVSENLNILQIIIKWFSKIFGGR